MSMKKSIVFLFMSFVVSLGIWGQRPNVPNQHIMSPLLQNMMNKSYLPYIVNVSAEIGLFDALGDKALTVTEISKKIKTKEIVTDALLEVLNAAGLISYSDGKYALSKVACDYLLTQSPQCQLDWLAKNVSVPVGAMSRLKESLSVEKKERNEHKKTEENKNTSVGMWQDKEKLIATKNQRLKDKQTQILIDFFVSLPEFDNCSKMVDYAGSIGYYSMAVLDKNQKLKAYVYDLPEVCNIALEVQKNEKNFNRVIFCPFDMRKDNLLSKDYDLFFVANALYGNRTKEKLLDFFKKANQSMVMGGVLVSNHWTIQHGADYISTIINELKNSLGGRPVHYIEENLLRQVLVEAGFDNFTVKYIDEEAPKPRLLIAARKVREL